MEHGRGLLFLRTSILFVLIFTGMGLAGFTAQAKGETQAAPMAVCTPDLTGMVGYWPMDDGLGATTFVDLIDPDGLHDATCAEGKCPDSTTGKVGGAFNFVYDEVALSGDEVNAPDFAGLDWSGGSSFSMEAWVNIPSSVTCHGNNKVFVGRRQGNISVWLGCGTGNKATFSVRDSNLDQAIASSTNAINDSLWHHVVGVHDATTNGVVVYLDGAPGLTDTQVFTGTFASSAELNFGWFDAIPFYWLTGSLDEVAAYNRALTAEEISAHYFNGLGQTYCNDAPVITSSGAQSSDEGTAPTLTVTAEDPEGDPFTLAASGYPPDLAFNAGSGQFSGTISYLAHVGLAPYLVNVTATETGGDGLVGTGSFDWTVNDVNRAPDVTNPGTQNSAEGAVINLPIAASDPDGDNTLSFSAANLPPGLAIDPASGVISGSIAYTATATSPYSSSVTVTDDAPFSDHVATPVQVTFTWNVTDTNQAPNITNATDRSNAESEAVSFQIQATDPDGNAITSYSAENLPPGLTLNTTTGLISGTVSYLAYTGAPYSVEITATDNGAPAMTGSATLTWTVTDTNRAPVLTKPNNQTSAEGAAINLPVIATDLDTDNELSFSATGLPDDLSIDPASGVISGTINHQAFSGSPYTVTVTVTDDAPSPLSDSETFTWNVTDVNAPPVVTNPGDQVNAEGDIVSLQIVAEDLDGDPLTYNATSMPDGLSIDTSTGLISGTLPPDSEGEYDTTVTVSDGQGNEVLIEFHWTVFRTLYRIYLPVVIKGG